MLAPPKTQCEALGITKQNAAQAQVIDFCLDDICRIDWLAHFPNIRECHVVNLGLNEIEGLDKCRYLERLWMNCNEIETIRQLDRLTMLRQLYLS